MNATGKRAILAAVIAALFMVAFAYQASAASPFTYVGKVIAMDHTNKILTVQAGPNNQRVFALNSWNMSSGGYGLSSSRNATITMCNKPVAWSSIKIGDRVSVHYFQKANNNYVADSISLLPVMGEHC